MKFGAIISIKLYIKYNLITSLSNDLDNARTDLNSKYLPYGTAIQTIYVGSDINTTTGKTMSKAERSRSTTLTISNRRAVKLTSDTYMCQVLAYTSSGSTTTGEGYIGKLTDSWTANEIIPFPSDIGGKLVLIFKRNDDAVMSSSDSSAIISALTFYVTTDKSLSHENESADALATGDSIRALQSALIAQEIDKSTATVIDYYMTMADGAITGIGVTVKTLYFKCAKNTLYKINHPYSGRFIVGCFSSVPEVGSIPTSFVIGTSSSKQEDITVIQTDNSAEYLAMYYYTQTYADHSESYTYNALTIQSLPADPSLTFANVPAEAKATGDAIKDLPLGFYVSHDTVELVSTTNGVIALYDALVSTHGDYISKNSLTKDGLTLYEYVLTSGNYNAKSGQREQDDEITKPTLLITSGVHGYEQSSIMALYSLCKALCENSFDLVDIKDYVTLRIIPVVCPSGYDADSRLNSNNVNINRNFASSSWTQTSAGQNYSGSSAGSETETQIVQEWLTAHKAEAVAYIDWHNSNYTDEISCLLGAVTETAMVFKAKYLLGINKVIPYWRKGRNIGDSNIYAYTGHTTTGGTAKSYGDDLGILSFTFETSWNVVSSGKHSAFSIGTGCEAFANMLIGLKSYFEI